MKRPQIFARPVKTSRTKALPPKETAQVASIARQLRPAARKRVLLFAGARGTIAAQALAKEMRLDLYRVDLAAVVGKFIGETEKNLDRLFDDAKNAEAVLLFDEADALFAKRTEVQDAHDRFANIEVSFLLQRMEAYAGLVILATKALPPLSSALKRRLRVYGFPPKR